MNYVELAKPVIAALTKIYGYDKILSPQIVINVNDPSEPYLYVILSDDFQSGLDWSDRFQHGYWNFYLVDDEFVIPSNFVMREMRELRVINKRLGNSKELFDKMASAAGREFAAKMELELQRSRHLLEAPKEGA